MVCDLQMTDAKQNIIKDLENNPSITFDEIRYKYCYDSSYHLIDHIFVIIYDAILKDNNIKSDIYLYTIVKMLNYVVDKKEINSRSIADRIERLNYLYSQRKIELLGNEDEEINRTNKVKSKIMDRFNYIDELINNQYNMYKKLIKNESYKYIFDELLNNPDLINRYYRHKPLIVMLFDKHPEFIARLKDSGLLSNISLEMKLMIRIYHQDFSTEHQDILQFEMKDIFNSTIPNDMILKLKGLSSNEDLLAYFFDYISSQYNINKEFDFQEVKNILTRIEKVNTFEVDKMWFCHTLNSLYKVISNHSSVSGFDGHYVNHDVKECLDKIQTIITKIPEVHLYDEELSKQLFCNNTLNYSYGCIVPDDRIMANPKDLTTRKSIAVINDKFPCESNKALDVVKNKNGYILFVHTPDITNLLKRNEYLNTVLIKEATNRGMTLNYQVGKYQKNIPLLPTKVVEESAFNRPKMQRNAITHIFRVNENGTIEKYYYCQSLIEIADVVTFNRINRNLLFLDECRNDPIYNLYQVLSNVYDNMVNNGIMNSVLNKENKGTFIDQMTDILPGYNVAKYFSENNLPLLYLNNKGENDYYSTLNDGYKPLGLECYARTTYPLSSSVDLINSQSMQNYMINNKRPIPISEQIVQTVNDKMDSCNKYLIKMRGYKK